MKAEIGDSHSVAIETFFVRISPASVGVSYDMFLLHLLIVYSSTVSRHSGSDRSFGTDAGGM